MTFPDSDLHQYNHISSLFNNFNKTPYANVDEVIVWEKSYLMKLSKLYNTVQENMSEQNIGVG